MAEKIKVTLSLSAEALRALAQLASERKRGELVSGLIVAACAAQTRQPLLPVEVAERLRELAALLAI